MLIRRCSGHWAASESTWATKHSGSFVISHCRFHGGGSIEGSISVGCLDVWVYSGGKKQPFSQVDIQLESLELGVGIHTVTPSYCHQRVSRRLKAAYLLLSCYHCLPILTSFAVSSLGGSLVVS